MPTLPKHEDKLVCSPRYANLNDWFWHLVDRMVELRGVRLSEGSSRETAILRQLQARRFTAAEAALAEHHVLYGQWSAEKTLRVGLELSDFYPETLTVTRSEWEGLRRRLYRAIQAQVQEEIHWTEQQTKDADADRGEIEQYRQAFRELNRCLQQANERVSLAMQSVETLRRDLQHAERRKTLLQAKLTATSDVILKLQRAMAEQTMCTYEPEPELPGQLSLFPEYDDTADGEFWDIFEEESNADGSLSPP